jgi:Tfp pilus assembly protein PilO
MTKQIIAIVLFVLAGAVFFGYTKPTYDQVRTHQVKVSQLDQLLEQRKSFDAKKAQLISMLNAFPPDNLLRLKRMLPDHVDNVRLILDLDNMASRYGMSIQDVTIKRAESESSDESVLGAINAQTSIYDSLTMQFSMRGTYANFVSFMNDLESSLRLVEVETITLNPDVSATVQGEPVYRISITVRTYWLK